MNRLGDVYPTIDDGNLGVIPPSGDGVRAIIGVSSAGTPNEVHILTDPADVASVLGRGTLAQRVARHLALGGGTVYAIPATASVAGTITAGQGNPALAIELGGVPNAALEVVVTITKGGALGTSEFTYSLDGGDTIVGPIATAANYAIPGTPHSLTFAAGNHLLGSVARFTVTAPTASVADLQTAIRVAIDSPLLFEYVHVAQPCDNSVWTVFDALALEAQTEFRYLWFLAEAPSVTSYASADAWVTALLAMRASFTSRYVVVVAADGEGPDTLNGLYTTQNLAGNLGARLSRYPISEDPGWVERGPVEGLSMVAPFKNTLSGKATTLNNGHALALRDAGYVTVRSFGGRSGWYWARGRTMAENTSDFMRLANLRVMLKAVTQVRQVWLDQVLGKVDPLNVEASLAFMKARSEEPLEQMVRDQDLVRGRVVIPPNQNILSSGKLVVQVRAVPFGYSEEIVLDVAFENPLLA